MDEQQLTYAVILAGASIVSLAMTRSVWRRHSPTSNVGALAMLAASVWLLAILFRTVSHDAPLKIFWDNAQLVGALIVPQLWVIYTLKYTGYDRWLTRGLVVLLVIPYLITATLALTNPAHHWVWTTQHMSPDGQYLIHEYGIVLRLYIVFAYILVGVGALVLVNALVRSRRLYRWQGTALLFAILTPWLVSLLSDALELKLLPGFGLTPLALGVTLPAIGWGFVRLQRLDLAPVTRELVFNGIDDAVIVLDAAQRIVELNRAARALIGYAAPVNVAQPVEPALPAWLAQAAQDATPESGGTIAHTAHGRTHFYDARVSALQDANARVLSRVVVLREVTERVENEARVKQSLSEKEVLLKEIHHRVKNNLQIISSLLNLQAERFNEPPMQEAFRDSQNRIRSMALIHERLYRSQDLARIDLAEYIQNLAGYLFRAYHASARHITLQVAAMPVELDIDAAIPCGLILNELISNALKHAFPDARAGAIRIGVTVRADQQIELSVADDGVGFPPDVDYRNTTSLGLQLVNTLVAQLNGALELTHGDGTVFTICFAPARR